MTSDSFIPGPDTTREFRNALGCFGTGVTVVTTTTPRGPLAITANSFSSVSLDPPLVLWSAARSSHRHDAFAAADRFVIHIMADDQQALALHFARSGEDFAGIDWAANADGQPVLSGVLARFDCHRHAVHAAGDHSIIVGHVDRAAYRPGLGLMFKRGQYGGFAGLD
jgi:flavin reductase (DIM6/NTAB) family NADH-FMN oxidoreductase RutF